VSPVASRGAGIRPLSRRLAPDGYRNAGAAPHLANVGAAPHLASQRIRSKLPPRTGQDAGDAPQPRLPQASAIPAGPSSTRRRSSRSAPGRVAPAAMRRRIRLASTRPLLRRSSMAISNNPGGSTGYPGRPSSTSRSGGALHVTSDDSSPVLGDTPEQAVGASSCVRRIPITTGRRLL
jgi:hypothetical protein